ncbi:MAG: hypothetical protein US45_C0018G0010 [Candidatus Nomurabacteria bacterium GW2011_GWA1_37_20]|uniref:Uncharacterized protein n=2 Tax=Parcubacteria group TaxID=1794811 RepID=A0A0G0L4G5_9BACT|nr:MAG: hypothetical protein US33_C0016G0010 [Parcubacteria group bacterium GW2011_GWC1_36_9]KKQ32531.1 MAG: hypothetical protein US45_C0018G0010 [Candidatus Nomurabacteria bacterium GW2011_GWA1_37_20]KKQ47556.1 MAG: hypothetical protein US65_C0008G0015 [Candidatus Yanofskybacteria bacterium GW2011_GWC2_37_9]
MIEKGKGGGNTITGLLFEKRVNTLTLLKSKDGYSIKGNSIFYNGKEVAKSFKKNALYKYLESKGLDYKRYISKKLLPDEAIYVIVNNTLFIIEIKFQKVSGSVDEKLQTCDFKRKQYSKLMAPLNIEVEYIYILNDWFRKPEYKDVLDYVISAGCQFYFHYLPLQKLGLPVPTSNIN